MNLHSIPDTPNLLNLKWNMVGCSPQIETGKHY